MTDDEIIELINAEFKLKTLAVTAQYLEIHQPVFEKALPKVDRVDRESQSEIITAYLPVENEYFYFAVYINEVKGEIVNVGTESRNLVCLCATSDSLTSDELKSFTKLKPTESWNKNDPKPGGRTYYSFSGIEFQPNPKPDEFEDKLAKLLTYLKQDEEGIIRLGQHAKTFIRVVMDFHSGNQLLGGLSIDSNNLKIMNELNLKIDSDFTAWGNPFK